MCHEWPDMPHACGGVLHPRDAVIVSPGEPRCIEYVCDRCCKCMTPEEAGVIVLEILRDRQRTCDVQEQGTGNRYPCGMPSCVAIIGEHTEAYRRISDAMRRLRDTCSPIVPVSVRPPAPMFPDMRILRAVRRPRRRITGVRVRSCVVSRIVRKRHT